MGAIFKEGFAKGTDEAGVIMIKRACIGGKEHRHWFPGFLLQPEKRNKGSGWWRETSLFAEQRVVVCS